MGEQWIIVLESKLEKIKLVSQMESQKKYYIRRLPRSYRESRENGFDPKAVSFGPYHHNQDHLKLLEPFKHQALINYLNRAGITLTEVTEAMQKIVKELMDSYQGLEETWTEDRFTELMLLDGCFLLDLMIWRSVISRPLTLRMDMLRLENQLPILVLAVLIEFGGHKDEDVANIFNCGHPDYEDSFTSKHKTVKDLRKMGHHILDIYTKNHSLQGDYFYDYTCSVHPASKLINSGVQFIVSDSMSLKDISFENGVLKLPKLKVHGDNESLLLNMLAYELLISGEEAVSSYILLMSNLISGNEDVAVLREKGIIRGMLGSDHEVADIFNRLPKPFVRGFGERSSVNVNVMLNAYCNRRLNRWGSKLCAVFLEESLGFFISSRCVFSFGSDCIPIVVHDHAILHEFMMVWFP